MFSQIKMGKLIGLLVFTLFVYHVQGKCEPVEKGVPSGDQQFIVNKHNEDRGLILKGTLPGQPKGKNLKTFKWDAALAAAGQKISDTCVFGHVKVNDTRWGWIGQNIYTWSINADSRGTDWNSAIAAWFDEYKTYTYSKTVYNHYTQVVWGNTEYVGCGYTAYKSGGSTHKLYVCNYGPGGNIVGQGPYELA